MNRILLASRVQLTTWKQTFSWPPAILALSFLINLAFFGSMGDTLGDAPSTGGVISIFIFQSITCSMLMTQGFSFAVGLNVTRRTFLAGTSVVIGLMSLTFSVLLYVLSIVEQLTNGWGMRLAYFTVLPVTRTYSPLVIVVFLVPMLLFSFTGLFLGVVAKRWGTNGVLSLMLATFVVAGGLAVLITWLQGWTPVGTWLAGQSTLALVAGWTLVPLVALAAGSYGLSRRAVP
jgi:hypothetical protein